MLHVSCFMNIGIDARMYGPKQTGIGNYIAYLIEHLAKVDKKNRYTIFLRKDGYSSFKLQDSRFEKVFADYPWYSWQEQWEFFLLLQRQNIDLMHFPHFNVPLAYRKPFVTTIHDLTPKHFPGQKVGKSWLRRKAYDVVLAHALKKARAIITPSLFTKNDMQKHFPDILSEKVHVIYEGIPNLKPEARGQKLEARKPYILYVGVWREHKNLAMLIHAFHVLKKRGLPHSLVIVGEPDMYYRSLSLLWKNLGLEYAIHTPGFVENEYLQHYYKGADCLVLPSLYEGFGLVPLEALRAGTPVAVSNIPALREILGKSAVFFNPKSKEDMAKQIARILKDKGLRKKLQREAETTLKRYRWNENAKKTLEVYKQARPRDRE